MLHEGVYADPARGGYALPPSWEAASEGVLATAHAQALAALSDPNCGDDLASYYNPAGRYAGTLFLDVEPNDPFSVEASDLYALTTLSITLDARHGRLLLGQGDTRNGVSRQLREVAEPELPITDLEHGKGGSAETLQRMYELHSRLRDLLPGESSRWVTAAKLCARKRPRLYPVRDNLVCVHLNGGSPLVRGSGLGNFSVDIQVFAYLMTSPQITARLSWLRADLEAADVRLDEVDLRLLDSALWMAARRDSSPSLSA